MNKEQSNKLEMYGRTRDFLSSTTATSGLTALPPKVASLGNKVNLIGDLFGVQMLPTEGATADRQATLDAAERASFVVAGPVLSYARSNGMAQLESLVNVSRTEYKALRQGHRMRLAQRILDTAQPLLVAAGPFGLTQEMLDTLSDKITVANAAVSGSQSVAGDKRVATLSIAQAFRDADAILDQIDPMMEPFRESQPEVFAHYQVARQIIDRPGVRSTEAPAPGANPSTTAPASAPSTPAAPTATAPDASALPKAA